MTARDPHHPIHLVVIGHDDHESSAVAGALARRLQRPLLDRTVCPEPSDEHDANVAGDDRAARTVDWYARTIRTDAESVIAAPVALLDRHEPPTRREAVWTVLLDDSGESAESVSDDEGRSRRSEAGRRLCDLRVDTSGHDTEHVVEEIAHAWERVRAARPTEGRRDAPATD